MKWIHTLWFWVIAISVSAQTIDLNYSKINYGQPTRYLTARSLALGGAGISGDDAAMGMLHNPALTVWTDSLFHFYAGMALNQLQEDRSFPYYDNFGGFVDYGSYMFTSNRYYDFYGIIGSRLPFLRSLNLSVSTGYIPFADFNYDYLEEVRSTGFGDALLAYNLFNSSGTLYAIPLNLGMTAYRGRIFEYDLSLSLGLGLHAVVGSLAQNWRIRVKDPSLEHLAYDIRVKRSLQNVPLRPGLGMQVQLGERLHLAGSYRHGYEIKFSQDTAVTSLPLDRDQVLSYPSQYNLGMSYRFQNILAARLYLDWSYTNWADFKDNWNENLSFENTMTVRAGVEHIFFNQVPFRVGFNYSTLRESNNYSQAMLALGTGLHLAQIRLDVAAGISSLRYFQQDLYDNAHYGQISSTEADRVKWNQFYGRIDLNYAF